MGREGWGVGSGGPSRGVGDQAPRSAERTPQSGQRMDEPGNRGRERGRAAGYGPWFTTTWPRALEAVFQLSGKIEVATGLHATVPLDLSLPPGLSPDRRGLGGTAGKVSE